MENVVDIYPLTPLQEGMLFHSLAAPGSGVYVQQVSFDIRGPLDVGALRRAWDRTVERHAILRTAFVWEGLDDPLQVVRERVDVPWEEEDWSGRPAQQRADSWSSLLTRDRGEGFDLGQAPLVRLRLIRLGPDLHRQLWTSHHLLLDGWSTATLLSEILALHEAMVTATPDPAPDPPPFRDYVAWLKSRSLDAAESFWKDRLAGFDEPTPLLFEPPSTATAGSRFHERVERSLTESETTGLRSVARDLRITLNTVAHGAWANVLHRYSGRDDVVYGTVVSGRPSELPDVEHMVGPFINTIPARVSIDPDRPWREWLVELQSNLLGARPHEQAPLGSVERWSPVASDQGLFESLLVFENYPEDPGPMGGQTRLEIDHLQFREQSNYPLALLVVPDERLRLIAIYDPRRFSKGGMDRLLAHVHASLGAFACGEGSAVADLPPPTAQERRELLRPWSYGDPVVGVEDVVDRIARHVHGTPDRIALSSPDAALSYRELDEVSNAVAVGLREAGFGLGSRVGVLAPRSPEAIVGMVGALKAGCAFVPLDPTSARGRLTRMIEATHVLLTARGAVVPDSGKVPQLRIDLSRSILETGFENPRASEAAYVIFTSGSTGEPKGVVVERGHLAASTAARFQHYGAAPDSFLLLSSLSVDSSVAGIWWTLCGGGTLVLPPSRIEQDLERLSSLVEAAGVTHTLLVPSLLAALLESPTTSRLRSLEAVIVAGEACSPAVVREHRRRLPRVRLYNEYGPSEATVWATVDELTRHTDGPVTIGRPVPGTQVHLLDGRLRPVPPGAVGELCIGGAGVARGYLDAPDATTEHFVATAEYGRLYKTGDLGRFRADGRIEFLGRSDDQIKIRGYRVEPAEIERALEQHPAVREAAVVLSDPRTPAEVDRLVIALLDHTDEDIERWLRAIEESA